MGLAPAGSVRNKSFHVQKPQGPLYCSSCCSRLRFHPVKAVARESAGIQIKICGLTSASDAASAAECGADLLGFLLWPKGKRAVSLDTARQIAAVARKHNIPAVALFVDEDAASIETACREVGATHAQLHGDKARQALPDLPTSLPVIYVMHATPAGVLQTPTPHDLQLSLGRAVPRSVAAAYKEHVMRLELCCCTLAAAHPVHQVSTYHEYDCL